MQSRRRVAWPVIAALTFGPAAVAARDQTPGPPASFESVNVCERITGDALAKAVGGRLLDTRPVNIKNFAPARCIYGVEIGGTRRTFVLWLNPAADYVGLRDAAEGPVKPVQGIGDAAHLTFDGDTKRHTLTALKKGMVTIQVSGDQVDWVETIAKVTISKF
jgi:hypothetical protein